MLPRRVLPSDQTPLSDEEYEFCLNKIAEWQEIFDTRPSIMPGSAWSVGSRPYDYLELILTGDRRKLDFLRFYTRFTGWSLFYGTWSPKYPAPPILPDNLDAIVGPCLFPDVWFAKLTALLSLQPAENVISPPRRFGEVGIDLNGITVNHDTYVYQERIALLYQSGILPWLRSKKRPRIVEIGSGFGGLAYRLLSILPNAEYTCIDLPESLIFANLYLGVTQPERTIRYIQASEASLVESADIVINTLSFAEMTKDQVMDYAKLTQKIIGLTGILFEQNQNNEPVGMIDCKPVLAEVLPYRQDIAPLPIIGNTEGLATIWANSPIAQLLESLSDDGSNIPSHP